MVKDDRLRISTNLKMTSSKGSLVFGIIGSCVSIITFLFIAYTDYHMFSWNALILGIIFSIIIGCFIATVLRILGIYIRRIRK